MKLFILHFAFVCSTFSFLLFNNYSAASQTVLDDEEEACGGTSDKKAEKLFKKGQNFLRDDPQEGVRLIKKALDFDPDYVEAYFSLARFNISTQAFGAARKYLHEVISRCSSYNVYAYLYLGRIYNDNGDYENAIKYLREFIKYPDKIKNDRDYNFAEEKIKNAEFFYQLFKQPVPFDPRTVEGICTEKDEYLPCISADNEVAFFTRAHMHQAMGDLWSKRIEVFSHSSRREQGFDAGLPMPPPFNRGLNEGGATLTIDNLHMYFTSCKTNSAGYYNCDIYTADYIFNDPEKFKELIREEAQFFGVNMDSLMANIPEYRWDSIRNLNDKLRKEAPEINLINAWESQPSISSVGNTLYFASDRSGGVGGLDLWKTGRDSTGVWSAPVNLGPVINTKDNEKSPFIHPDDMTLYFSSDGHKGLGGHDIFFTKKDSLGQWQKPLNIGYPINTEEDDLGFFASTDGKTGYFSSNKKELNGKGGWDLYSFPLYEGARPEKVLFVKGKVVDEAGIAVSDAEIALRNVRTKEVERIAVESNTGKYAKVVTLEQEDDFILTINKEDYAFTAKYISTKDTVNQKPVTVDMQVIPMEIGKAYNLENIHFAFNSVDVLTEGSMAILDEFVEFLNENSSVKVAIHGHTDDVGTDESNLELSQKRAKAVNDFLVLHGIEGPRLSHRGLGETKPVAGNTTEEGRAKNRRTEFVILEM